MDFATQRIVIWSDSDVLGLTAGLRWDNVCAIEHEYFARKVVEIKILKYCARLLTRAILFGNIGNCPLTAVLAGQATAG
jgi:hypothetical protein